MSSSASVTNKNLSSSYVRLSCSANLVALAQMTALKVGADTDCHVWTDEGLGLLFMRRK